MNDADGQRLLIAAGYNLGPTGPSGRGDDGRWGKLSTLACSIFQRSRGLAATGRLDAETVKALQAAVAEKRPAAVMTVSDRGRAELLSHEAIVTAPYKDSEGIWTVGVGHTKAAGAPDPVAMTKGVQRPVAEMVDLFLRDLPKYEAEVRAAVKAPLKQHQFDALVSFHFNTGAIGRASFIKLLNAGDLVGAAKGFMDWKKPAAIIGRRRAEQALFRDGVYGADGKVSIYPASSTGAVQWSKGRRVAVAELL